MACESLPGRIFFGCCPTDRIKIIGWHISMAGYVPFTWRTMTSFSAVYQWQTWRWEVTDRGWREETFGYPNPDSDHTYNIQGGLCPRVSFASESADWITPGRPGPWDYLGSPVVERTETKLVTQSGSTRKFTATLSRPVREDDAFGRLIGMEGRINEVFDRIEWGRLPRDPRSLGGGATMGERCGGQMDIPGTNVSGLQGPMGVERAYMAMTGPSPQNVANDGGGRNDLVWYARWNGYAQKVYAQLMAGRRYCKVSRRGIPWPQSHHPSEAHLDLVGGTTESCTQHTGGIIEISPPKCALNDNAAIDFWTAFSENSPPACCGMAP